MPSLPPSLAGIGTLPELLAFRLAQTPGAEAYRAFDEAAGRWVSATWAEAGERIAHWRRALGAMALPRQSRIAILLPNGLDAVCLDQAALALGLVPVPLHAIDNPGSIAYILSDCEAALLMTASLAQWRAIEGAGLALPAKAFRCCRWPACWRRGRACPIAPRRRRPTSWRPSSTPRAPPASPRA